MLFCVDVSVGKSVSAYFCVFKCVYVLSVGKSVSAYFCVFKCVYVSSVDKFRKTPIKKTYKGVGNLNNRCNEKL